MPETKVHSLFNSIYDALIFLTKSWAIPKNVLLDAASAALKVIEEYINQTNEQHSEKNEG